MSIKVFIAQSALDAWITDDRVGLQGDVLTLHGGGGSLRLDPAALFATVSAGSDARWKLVGKVKSQSAIAALGGESVHTSVVLGDTAYEVEPGFVASTTAAGGESALLTALRTLAS